MAEMIVKHSQLLSLEALLRRWKGVEDKSDLANKVRDDGLPAYKIWKVYTSKDGELISLEQLVLGPKPIWNPKPWPGQKCLGPLANAVFVAEDVIKFEKSHSYVLWKRGKVQEGSIASPGIDIAQITPDYQTSMGQNRPTISIIKRLQEAGEKNREIAERYASFFGYHDGCNWERVYERMKKFMQGKYKGNHRV